MPLRIKAFLIHLAISLIILIGLLYIVVFKWYPPPFFAHDGGWQGVRLIIGVDLVLGPLLTLAVYNPAKGMHILKRDLMTIAAVQIIALGAGSYIVADQRTRMVTFADTRFVSMSESQIRDSAVTPAVLKTLQTSTPPMAYVDLPEDKAKRAQFVMSTLGGVPLFKRGDLYQPLTADNRRKIMAEGFDLDHVAVVDPDLKPMVSEFLASINKTSTQVKALPLYCRYGVVTLVMDIETGEIIDTINISHDRLLASLSYDRLQKKAQTE